MHHGKVIPFAYGGGNFHRCGYGVGSAEFGRIHSQSASFSIGVWSWSSRPQAATR